MEAYIVLKCMYVHQVYAGALKGQKSHQISLNRNHRLDSY